MTTYIAGPMTGHPDFNYPAFAYAATVLRAKGIDVRSPHEVDCPPKSETETWPTYHQTQVTIPAELRTWEWYMRRTLQMLLECDEVVLLPGWETSRGATLERQVAESLGMPISEWQGSAA